jgi:RNA 3'-terminal phosphate cyclase (ATP)
MIEIDGSLGEGGGQILRSALTLSLLAQKPFRIKNIRARRKKSGLRPQHLASVQAAMAVGKARVSGNQIGSRDLTFEPNGLHSGDFRLEIGTAGACSLVLQTIFLPLAHVGSSSSVEISGGTHVPWSPTYEYIERVWLPFLRSMGYMGSVELVRAGYYPKGGGQVLVSVEPMKIAAGLTAERQDPYQELIGISLSSNLPGHVAERQRARAVERLKGIMDVEIMIDRPDSPGVGSSIFVTTKRQPAAFGFSALGSKGKPAERVADEVVDQFFAFIDTRAALDRFLADQVLIPLALTPEPSLFTTEVITGHLRTNAEIVQKFLEVDITIIETAADQPARVEISQAPIT